MYFFLENFWDVLCHVSEKLLDFIPVKPSVFLDIGSIDLFFSAERSKMNGYCLVSTTWFDSYFDFGFLLNYWGWMSRFSWFSLQFNIQVNVEMKGRVNLKADKKLGLQISVCSYVESLTFFHVTFVEIYEYFT